MAAASAEASATLMSALFVVIGATGRVFKPTPPSRLSAAARSSMTRAPRRLIVIAHAVTNAVGEVRERLNRAVSKAAHNESPKTLRRNEISGPSPFRRGASCCQKGPPGACREAEAVYLPYT